MNVGVVPLLWSRFFSQVGCVRVYRLWSWMWILHSSAIPGVWRIQIPWMLDKTFLNECELSEFIYRLSTVLQCVLHLDPRLSSCWRWYIKVSNSGSSQMAWCAFIRLCRSCGRLFLNWSCKGWGFFIILLFSCSWISNLSSDVQIFCYCV